MKRPSQVVAALEHRGAAAVRRARHRAVVRWKWAGLAEPTHREPAPAGPADGACVPIDPYAVLQQAVGAVLVPPLPTPEGLSVDDVDRMMQTFEVDGSPRGELDPYVADSLWRFLYTWELARPHRGRALELGANPYFTTVLLQRHSELELHLANYFGEGRPGSDSQEVRYEGADGEREIVTMEFAHFDVEHDRFPYDDESFDLVLFCEIIEHLLEDPVATLREINRVLRPGGALVLTTPNVSRLENVLRMVDGENIYDPYSGYGPYGRHNREFTEADLRLVLAFTGFEVDRTFTADSHRWEARRPELVDGLAPFLRDRSERLGHYTFVHSTKQGAPLEGRPSAIYRSLPPDQIVEYPPPT